MLIGRETSISWVGFGKLEPGGLYSDTPAKPNITNQLLSGKNDILRDSAHQKGDLCQTQKLRQRANCYIKLQKLK